MWIYFLEQHNSHSLRSFEDKYVAPKQTNFVCEIIYFIFISKWFRVKGLLLKKSKSLRQAKTNTCISSSHNYTILWAYWETKIKSLHIFLCFSRSAPKRTLQTPNAPCTSHKFAGSHLAESVGSWRQLLYFQETGFVVLVFLGPC